MSLPSMSLHWSEGDNGGGSLGGSRRSFSKGSIYRHHFLSLDHSSARDVAVGLSRDVTNDRRATGTSAGFEWLQPWRTPQDCREGGVALLYSMQEVLENVRRARKTSLSELYAARGAGSPAASTTSLCHPQHLCPPRAATSGSSDDAEGRCGSVGEKSSCSAAGSRTSSVDRRRQRDRGERNVSVGKGVRSASDDSVQGIELATEVGRVAFSPPLQTATAAAASVPPIVPVIPRFSERRRCALANSDDDDDDAARSPHHPDASCPSGGCDQTARPGDSRHRPGMSVEWSGSDSNGDEPEALAQRRHASGVSADDDDVDTSNVHHGKDEERDEEEDRLSETDFGEGGHLACVPGDTLHQRYTLLKALGVGRSSRVWLAVDLEQCSLARCQLIRELGEREVRRLFRTLERPMFVAIKVFRCDPAYADCATYERAATEERTARHGLVTKLRATAFSGRLTTVRDAFAVEGAFGTHQCLVMDVLGAGVDRAINEAHLNGFPSAVARSIMQSSLQGLVLLAACHLVHTDIKPENLFFTDLEDDVAEEMLTFQSAQLHASQRQTLCSSFAHRSTAASRNILELVNAAPSLIPHCLITHTSTKRRLTCTPSTLPTPPMRVRQAIAAVAGGHDTLHSSQDSIAQVSRRPNFARTPTRRRSAYDVRLSGLGLSLVVPPCLRLGVRVLANYAADGGGMTADELPWREERWRLAGTCAPAESPPPPTLDIGMSEDFIDEAELRALGLQELPKSDADGGRCAAGMAPDEYEEADVTDFVGVPAVDKPAAHHRTTVTTADVGVVGGTLPPATWRTASAATRAGGGRRTPLAAAKRRLFAQCFHEGLATPRDPATVLTRCEGCEIVRHQNYRRGAVLQSREYRAPEVLLGDFVLPACDIWSMGCIAYELVSGRFLIDCIQRLNKWDGRPVYLEDTEQDLDVFHLKAIMRLLGPPPVSFLRQQPIGLFIDDFFDEHGNFRFWERGEAEEAGMRLADPYRQLELTHWAAASRVSGASVAVGSGADRQQSPPLPESVSGVAASLDTDPPGAPFAASVGQHVASAQARRDPQDTMNYPIRTPAWQDVQAILREKLGSAEEAADFEVFLRRCLQWDPARRATAAELLADKWLVKYSGVVADASESDVVAEKEGGGDSDGEERRL
ncbi:Protein kinase domain family protein [Leishmania donovani]|uniref:non-specific serine/threonine protein kinase n=1 Tax=Leishmania donovani TaxID=5661 RepID=A0A504XPG2_LEIDO|nr:Protein kinase domain family protein [Leishmania donovani]